MTQQVRAFSIDSELALEFKQYCAQVGRKQSHVLSELMRTELGKTKPETAQPNQEVTQQ